jgi:hypothetical protein
LISFRSDRSFHWRLNNKPSLTFTYSGPWLKNHALLCRWLFFPCSVVFYLHAVSTTILLLKLPISERVSLCIRVVSLFLRTKCTDIFDSSPIYTRHGAITACRYSH